MAAAALTTAARRSAHSASSIVTRELTGSHKLTIDGYKLSRKIPRAWHETSQIFEAGGYSWRIIYIPRSDSAVQYGDDCISLFLKLANADHLATETDPVQFKFTLLDQAGNPMPKYSRSKELCTFSNSKGSRWLGFHDFMKHKDLEESGCLKDDRFTVKCDITAIRDWQTENVDVGDNNTITTRVTVPPSDLHKHLNNLLWKKQGTDVTLDVGGEKFDAHRWMLAARSPVLEADIASMKKKNGSAGVMKIDGIKPKVFKAMLHFLYTDSLPAADMEDTTVAMFQDLLAAAHRYELERLRLICEEALCKRIDVSTVAGTLAVAEQHGCHALKAACVEFIGRPGNLTTIMGTEGFDKIKANCPVVLMELVMKQLA